MEKDRTGSGVLTFIGVVVFFAVMKIGASILIPLGIALFIFILVSPAMEKLERLRVPSFIAMALVLFLVAGVGIAFVSVLFRMANTIMEKLPEYIARVARFDSYISIRIREIANLSEEEFPSFISVLNIDWVGYVKSFVSSASSVSISVLKNVAMILLYLMFLLMERKSIFPKIRAAFPESRHEAEALVRNIGRQTSTYLSVKVLISAATGILFYLTALLSGMDFPFVWGVMAFLLNFIPTIGSIVVTASATLMAAIQFMPLWSRVFIIIFSFLVIQMVLGNVIDPKLQGVQLNLSPLVILVMLSLWGYVWGIVGMFLAVPMTSVIHVICSNIPSLGGVAVLLSSGGNLGRK